MERAGLGDPKAGGYLGDVWLRDRELLDVLSVLRRHFGSVVVVSFARNERRGAELAADPWFASEQGRLFGDDEGTEPGRRSDVGEDQAASDVYRRSS
jgi:hypothetical protein